MDVERAADHPTFELGGNKVTSFAAPARGAHETALFRIDIPPGGGLPPHHHDHLDVFTVTVGSGTIHIGDDSHEVVVGDSVVVPIGIVHYLESGGEGATIVVTMLAGTRLVRPDGTETIPPWVS
jgi:quercetin dioxygenase-like cupin family protein